MAFFNNLPVFWKIILGLAALGVMLVVGVLVFFFIAAQRYTRTEETPLVQLNCGTDSLTINAVRSWYVGGSSVGHRLYWNGKAVAKRSVSEGDGQSDQPVPIDADDQNTLFIKKLPTDTTTTNWTVWVSPGVFSRAEFDALAACIVQHRAELVRQLATTPTHRPDESYFPALNTNLNIGAVVYGLADSIRPRLYSRTMPWGEQYELSIDPGGRVDLRQDNRTMTLGEVSLENGTRVLTWSYSAEMTVRGRDLPDFKNERGEPLSARYRLRHAANDGQVFFRQTPTEYQHLFMPAPNPQHLTDSLSVNALVVSLQYPNVGGMNYTAGTLPPPDGRTKPVFHWRTWLEHPITEADLRQFHNEAGQGLGEVYDFVELLDD